MLGSFRQLITGTLAGLTFALQKGRIVAASSIITGIAAVFSFGIGLLVRFFFDIEV